MASVWTELRRRNVVKVAVAYAIVGWLLVEVASVVLPTFKAPEWIMQVFTFLVIVGFPLALIFAWAFELTPEGIKREKDVDRSQSITHVTGRNIDYIIIAALVLALGFFAFDKFVLDPSRDAELVQAATEARTSKMPDKSIAVLAFTDLSPEGDQEYFSDGISEELLNVLAKIPGLRVAARTSSFRFKGQNLDIIDIGHQLNVAYVLEGSVRKAGSQLRITAQLVDASNGFHLWSETYDRELANIFAVQDEISAAIVNALKEHLGLEVEAVPRVIAAANTEAHAAYLRGRHLVVQRTRATIEGAVREFEKAIALDPGYALAHAELAIAILLLKRGSYGDLPVTEAVASAAPHAERAMALDPALAEAHAATGFVLWDQENLEEAVTQFEQAIQINPNYSNAYLWMGSLFGDRLGRYAEAFAAQEMTLRLNPLSIPTIFNIVGGLMERNRLDEADRELDKLASIAPSIYASLRGRLSSLGGKWANAVLGSLDGLRIDPENADAKDDLTWQFAFIGLEKEALAILKVPQPYVLTVLGRTEDAVTTAQTRLTEELTFRARSHLGLTLAGTGDYVRARPILEEMWQRSGGRVTRNGLFQTDKAAALIAIRRDAGGEKTEVGELLAAIKDNVRRYREAGVIRANWWVSVDYEEGLAAYLAGEREKGLVLISKAAEDGFFIPPKDAYLQVLYDDPGFAPIRASQEVRQARERKRFLDVVCTDNPYAAIWQPEEGTCERIAAEGGN